MSQENVEIVRRALSAFNQRAFDRTTEGDLSVYDSNVVLDTTTGAFDGGVNRGLDGLREGLSRVLGMWKRASGLNRRSSFQSASITSSSRFG